MALSVSSGKRAIVRVPALTRRATNRISYVLRHSGDQLALERTALELTIHQRLLWNSQAASLTATPPAELRF